MTEAKEIPRSVTFMQILGRTIREHRKRHGLTQSVVASSTHLSCTSLSRIETGDVSIQVSHLRRIAKRFDTKAHVILREAESAWGRL